MCDGDDVGRWLWRRGVVGEVASVVCVRIVVGVTSVPSPLHSPAAWSFKFLAQSVAYRIVCKSDARAVVVAGVLLLLQHTGEKPYACSYCPYTAAQKKQITVHERAHLRRLAKQQQLLQPASQQPAADDSVDVVGVDGVAGSSSHGGGASSGGRRGEFQRPRHLLLTGRSRAAVSREWRVLSCSRRARLDHYA